MIDFAEDWELLGKVSREKGAAMSRLALVSFGGILALTMVGCNSQSKVSSVATPSTSTSPASQQPLPFVKPPVISKPSAPQIAVAPGLIQSTNPNERTKEVIKGRSDPFALLPGEATVNSPPSIPTPFISAVSLPRFQPSARSPKITSAGHPSSSPTPLLPPPPSGNAGSQFNPGHGNLLPPAPTPSTATAPQLPPPPTTDLAKGVTVTGVVQVGDEMEAIVKAPNEATSRTVRAGQRLSDGQVLVKRIEINQDSPPVVILEQNGTEVARAVGEGVTGATASTKSTADNSNSPSPASSSDENFMGDR